MNVVKEWIEAHPNLWEFIKFNILSNVATIVNFIVMLDRNGYIYRIWMGIRYRFNF